MSFSVSYVYRIRDKYSPSLKKISRHTAQFNKRVEAMGSRLQNAGSQLGGMQTALGALIGALGGAKILGSFIDFDKAMNKVSSVTLASAEDLSKLRMRAKELGATTQYTAGQVAEGMIFLATAGLKTGKIIDSIEPSLRLAAASGVDLGQSADIVTNVMAQMGLGTDQLTRVVDNLSFAQANANTNVTELFEAMRPVGATANNLSLSVEGLSVALSAMANAGEKGSIAGTLFRNMLTNVAGASSKQLKIYKALGINLTEFIDPLTRKFKGDEGLLGFIKALQRQGNRLSVPVLQGLFGERGFRAAQLLIAQEGSLRDMLTKYRKASELGVSAEMMGRQMRGLPGVILTLKSAIEALSIAIVESGVDKMLIDIGNRFIGIIRAVTKTNPTLLKWAAIGAMTTTVLLGLVTALGITASAVGSLIMAFKMAGIAGIVAKLKYLVAAMSALQIVVLSAVAAWSLFIIRTKAAYGATATWGQYFKMLLSDLGALFNPLTALKQYVSWIKNIKLTDIFAPLLKGIKAVLTPTKTFVKAVKYLRSGAVKEKALSAAEGLKKATWGRMKDFLGFNKDDESATLGKPAAMQGNLNGSIVVSAEPGSQIKRSALTSSLPGNLGINNAAAGAF